MKPGCIWMKPEVGSKCQMLAAMKGSLRIELLSLLDAGRWHVGS